jgi:mono/diheme cytochrome c family protein
VKKFALSLAIALFFDIMIIASVQAQGMMGSGEKNAGETSQEISGTRIYNDNCRVCHQNGGNVVNPAMPLRGSMKLASFDTFLSFIRDPRMPDGSKGPMPAFSKTQISDKQAKDLYQYITSRRGLDLTSRGQGGWYCPNCGQYMGPYGGRGMGPGMMGGYGMGSGMMGPGYYNQNEECQKFLDETAGLRKELYNKRFEYGEALRNPKTTQETEANLRKEIDELQGEISKKAPLGCYQY